MTVALELGTGLVTHLVLRLAVPPAVLPVGWASRVPVEPTRDEARSWAVEELSRREYAEQRPGILEQVVGWILDRLGQVGEVGSGTGTAFALVVGVVLVLVVVGVLVTGRVLRRATQTTGAAVFDRDAVGPASAYRAAADAAAARGDWRTAVVERFRTVVRELEERAVLVPQPGRTADEAVAEAARFLPSRGEDLRSAARLFDDVRYGDRDADAAGDEALRRLDEQVRAARVAAVEAPSGPAR